MVALRHLASSWGVVDQPSAQSDFHLASFLKSYKTIRAELQHGRLPDDHATIAARLFLLLILLPSVFALAQELSKQEAAIVHSIDEQAPAAVDLLESIVNVNSGTFNAAGVVVVGKILEKELQALGFTNQWVPMDAVKRAPSLVAEHKGTGGKRVLLIGHMDTVFEPSSPFQKLVRTGDTAVGPGTADMKGGIVVVLFALKALKTAGALDNATITVFLTGDEESVGDPGEVARKEFIEAGKKSDCVLSFEPLTTQQGKDYATTARRGGTRWDLQVQAKAGHSSQIFSDSMGDGAIFELSRILSRFHDTLREPNLTFSAGLALGGSNTRLEASGDASVSGKLNIVPGEARAIGDIRALSPEQLARVKERMQSIVTQGNLPRTKAEITFRDLYPPMPPTAGNAALLSKLNEVNRALVAPNMEAADPMIRGAGDASFVAPFVAVLDGLGAPGTGMHAPGESVDLARFPLQTKRVALLIYRLTQEPSR
jgi:glutamate carboxypeptidase